MRFFYIFVAASLTLPALAKEAPINKDAKKMNAATATAYFAGGCFWCMEKPFESQDGVHSVVSGYSGGPEKNPSYKQVASGKTGHREAVKVTYDPTKLSYDDVLQVFWRSLNPTDKDGQFADRGLSYAPAIFFENDAQKEAAEKSKKALDASKRFKRPVVVPIVAFKNFYPAEDYHQDYYKKSPVRYQLYYTNSGRKGFLEAAWGKDLKYKPKGAHPMKKTETKEKKMTYTKPSAEEIKAKLTDIQFQVTQKDGTERPFKNEYWDNKKDGIYVDIVSGEPLFSSLDKYESGTGWPSFTKPIDPEYIVTKTDKSWFMTRTEVRSKYGDSHLGHVFGDGPQPTGQRYCMNSASMRFIPVAKLDEEGYGKFKDLFKDREVAAEK